MVARPPQNQYRTPKSGGFGGRGGIIPRDEPPAAAQELYWLAKNCNAVRLSIDTIKNYIFRNGIEFEPTYSRECLECGTRFEPDAEPEYCGVCEHGKETEALTDEEGSWYREPSDAALEQVREYLTRIDENGNTFLDAMRLYEEWLNILDDSFLICRQDYDLDDDGNIVDWTLEEMFVADSRNFRITGDPDTLNPGGEYWICIASDCRPGPSEDEQDDMYQYVAGPGQGRVYTDPGRCDRCDKQLHEVWYVATQDAGGEEPVNYYLPREVIHTSKYSAQYGYGYSPILSVTDMALLLVSQESYMRSFYEEERTPRMMVSVNTRNPDQVRRIKQVMEDKNVSQGGHHVPFVSYPGTDGKGGFQVHELSKLPSELDYENVRDEAYRRIGATFGINAAIQGNVDAGGLQNQGPAQWQVTDRAVELGQATYNEKVFPQLLDILRIECRECDGRGCGVCGDGKIHLDDWELKLAEGKEQDNLEETQVQLARVQEAMQMQQAGFEIKRRNPDGTFVFSDEPTQEPMQGGGMGGGQGGFGGGGFDARGRESFGSFGQESSAEEGGGI